jgi:hypothetical protein
VGCRSYYYRAFACRKSFEEEACYRTGWESAHFIEANIVVLRESFHNFPAPFNLENTLTAVLFACQEARLVVWKLVEGPKINNEARKGRARVRHRYGSYYVIRAVSSHGRIGRGNGDRILEQVQVRPEDLLCRGIDTRIRGTRKTKASGGLTDLVRTIDILVSLEHQVNHVWLPSLNPAQACRPRLSEKFLFVRHANQTLFQ